LKKIFYLFLALLLPALVFVFLKYAGKNEFNIPVYFEQGVDKVPAGCDRTYPAPYLLDENSWIGHARGDANVIVFPDAGTDFARIDAALRNEFGKAVTIEEGCNRVDSSSCDELRRCTFILESPNQAVLFERNGSIRGYYDLTKRDELDRLRVELKILLKKY
jgi:protein SCO1/2